MSEEQDLTQRLAAVIADLPLSMRPAIEEANGEIVRLRKANLEGDQVFFSERRKHDDTKGLLTNALEDNDDLRIRLHACELEAARLRGYQDRVNEFDPVSDRNAYEDRLPRPRHEHNGQHGAGMVSYLDGRERRPWFARRGA